MGIMNDTRFEKMDFQRIIEEQVRKNIVNNGNQQTVKTVTHSLGDVMQIFINYLTLEGKHKEALDRIAVLERELREHKRKRSLSPDLKCIKRPTQGKLTKSQEKERIEQEQPTELITILDTQNFSTEIVEKTLEETRNNETLNEEKQTKDVFMAKSPVFKTKSSRRISPRTVKATKNLQNDSTWSSVMETFNEVLSTDNQILEIEETWVNSKTKAPETKETVVVPPAAAKPLQKETFVPPAAAVKPLALKLTEKASLLKHHSTHVKLKSPEKVILKADKKIIKKSSPEKKQEAKPKEPVKLISKKDLLPQKKTTGTNNNGKKTLLDDDFPYNPNEKRYKQLILPYVQQPVHKFTDLSAEVNKETPKTPVKQASQEVNDENDQEVASSQASSILEEIEETVKVDTLPFKVPTQFEEIEETINPDTEFFIPENDVEEENSALDLIEASPPGSRASTRSRDHFTSKANNVLDDNIEEICLDTQQPMDVDCDLNVKIRTSPLKERNKEASKAKRHLMDYLNETADEFPKKSDRVEKEATELPRYRRTKQVNEVPYVESPVRKKADRAKLQGWSCERCRDYYGQMNLSPRSLKEKMNACSRHRSKFPPRDPSPEGMWNPGFPETGWQSFEGED